MYHEFHRDIFINSHIQPQLHLHKLQHTTRIHPSFCSLILLYPLFYYLGSTLKGILYNLISHNAIQSSHLTSSLLLPTIYKSHPHTQPIPTLKPP